MTSTARILVVDDESGIRHTLTQLFTRMGYQAAEAITGQEALGLIAETSFDLVILDIGMPELDGLEVCRQVRKSSEVPILFLSARDEEIDRVIGLEIGGDDYVSKPVTAEALSEVLENHLAADESTRVTLPDGGPTETTPVEIERIQEITDGDPEFEQELLEIVSVLLRCTS